MEKVIYSSGVNTIYELADAYKLVNQKGNFAILDKDEKILSKIVQLLHGERSFYYNENSKMFYLNIFENGIGKFYCSLRQLVITVAMDGDFEKNLETVRNKTILLVNETEHWNLKRENLEYTAADNNINTFYDDGKYFYIRHNKTGYTVRTDLDKEFNEFLRKYRWAYSVGCKTLGTFFGKNQRNYISIHQLVRIYFDSDEENMEDLESWTKILRQAMKKVRINVDHLDSDKNNCCQDNLTWIKSKDNIKKSNLTKKLNQNPFKCKVKVSENAIHMSAGYAVDNFNIEVTMIYESVSDFVEGIKNFWYDGILCDVNGMKISLPVIPKEYFGMKATQ